MPKDSLKEALDLYPSANYQMTMCKTTVPATATIVTASIPVAKV